MKKSYLLAALGGLLAAAPAMAANYDFYITGSTAFRPNVFAACQKIFDNGAPTIQNKLGGGAPGSGDNNWAMQGTCTNFGVTSGSDTLTIHGFFTGSVQGFHSIGNNDLLGFCDASGTVNSNYATVAFSDVYSKSTIAPLSSGFIEANVAAQPFVMVKSTAATGVANIQNVTFQQIQSMITPGTAPLSYFTGNYNDNGTTVYLLHRSLDSGTRVTTILESKSSGTVKVRYWDAASHSFITATNRGPALYGPGYVGGGDVKTALQGYDNANQSIAYLSFADARAITTTNWSNILKFDGLYPIANWTPNVNAPGMTGGAATNDFSPISTGQYSFWAFEVLAYPNSTQWSSQSGQNLDYTSQLTPLINRLLASNGGGAYASPLNGSIDYEIEASKTVSPYATAVRLSEVQVSRTAVGGKISP